MEWEYRELKPLPEKHVMVVGIPDVGLVGPIATSFLVKNLKLELAGYLDSETLPPLMLFHDSKPLMPLRVYSDSKTISVFYSEIALPPSEMYSFSNYLMRLVSEKGVERIIMLGGIAVPNRMSIDKPKVYVAAVREEDRKFFSERNFLLLKEGFVSGVYATILKQCYKRDFSGIALLAESHLNYPDPGAAASVINSLSSILGIDIDVKPLLEQEEEIRVKLRELMRRTMESIKTSGKEYEFTVPAMYA